MRTEETMKNLDLAIQYWQGGARAIVIEKEIAEFDGYPVMIKFGEYDKPCKPCFAAIAFVGADNGGYDRVLATDEGIGRLKAKVKKMTRPAAPIPSPAPASPALVLRHPGTPTVAEQVGLSLSYVREIVDGLADLERQHRVAQALAKQQRRAAQEWRQRMIGAGIVKPAQECA